MPIVRIDVQSGKSTAYKRAILHGVRRAITFSLGVGDERIMSRLIETPGENIDTGEYRSDSFTVVEIAMLEGRGAELKFKLYENIVRELRFSPGIVARDVVVYVYDPPAESFCIRGETAGESVERPGGSENRGPAEEPSPADEAWAEPSGDAVQPAVDEPRPAERADSAGDATIEHT